MNFSLLEFEPLTWPAPVYSRGRDKLQSRIRTGNGTPAHLV